MYQAAYQTAQEHVNAIKHSYTARAVVTINASDGGSLIGIQIQYLGDPSNLLQDEKGDG